MNYNEFIDKIECMQSLIDNFKLVKNYINNFNFLNIEKFVLSLHFHKFKLAKLRYLILCNMDKMTVLFVRHQPLNWNIEKMFINSKYTVINK
jgi:hypothetical protein